MVEYRTKSTCFLILLYINVFELGRPVDASNVALLGRLGGPLGGSWVSLGVSWGPEDGPGTRLEEVLKGCQDKDDSQCVLERF